MIEIELILRHISCNDKIESSGSNWEVKHVKMIILSAVAALILAYAASFILNREQEPAYQAFVGSGARVGDPGTNLVGPEWSGQPRPPQS